MSLSGNTTLLQNLLSEVNSMPMVTNQSKTVTPSTSQQVVTYDSGYTGLEQVTVSAMPAGTLGTVSATKGAVSNNSVSVTPQISAGTAGYNAMAAKSGAAVSVTASELVSGNKALTPSTSAQTNIDVTNYATASVAAIQTETKNMTLGSAAPSAVNPTSGKFLTSVSPSIDTSVIKSDNIKSGATILGVSGSSSVVNTSDANAAAPDILSGKTAYVNGSKVTGTKTISLQNKTVTSNGSVTAGSGYDGLGTVTVSIPTYNGSVT